MGGRDWNGRSDRPADQGATRDQSLLGRPGERARAALADAADEVQVELDGDVSALVQSCCGSGGESDAEASPANWHPRKVLGTCVDAFVGARRLAGWCEWVQLLAVARLLTAWTGRPPILDERLGPDPCGQGEFADPALAARLNAVVRDLRVHVPTGERLDTAELADAFVAAEVAAAAGISASAGWQRVHAATTLFLTDRLPRTRALLKAGMLDATKLRTILTGTGVVADDAVCGLLETRLVPDADFELAVVAATPGHVLDVLDDAANPDGPGSLLPWVCRVSNPTLQARIMRLVAELDAEAAAERAAKARADRHVGAEALPDGMGAITVNTGREEVTAIIGDLDACVATAKAGGDARTPDQIRADELVHRMSLGAFGAPAVALQAGPNRCAHAGTAAVSSIDRTTDAACSSASVGAGNCSCHGSGGSEARGVRALRVSLTMPLSTWIGVADEPGVLDGYGPIPAALARQIAAEAAHDHPVTTTWRCLPLDDRHRTVIGVGDTIPTPRHDPTDRQRILAVTADPTCVWPGCGRRSVSHGTDVDHRIPYEDGGATCPCNLQALCRKHHRLKGTGLINAVADPHSRPGARLGTGDDDSSALSAEEGDGAPVATPVGSVLWSSWTGRSYRYTPPAETEAPLSSDERAVLAGARLRRGLDRTGDWADPNSPGNADGSTARDLRVRLHGIAGGRDPGSAQTPACNPVDLSTGTATGSWRHSTQRQDRREAGQAARDAARQARRDRLHLTTDLSDDRTDQACPF